MMNESALIIMAKEPLVGKTKTRLSPPLSPEQAAAFYEALLLDTIKLCAEIKNIDLAVASTPPESIGYFVNATPPGTRILPAACEHIGGCLSLVIGELLDMGYHKVLAINSDGPSLPPNYIDKAIVLLGNCDLVLGPGEDGGYYLIGLKSHRPPLFEGIAWSTSRVLEQTTAKASQLGLTTALLPSWYDIDTGRDIKRLMAELGNLPDDRLINTRRFFKRHMPHISS